MKSQSLSFPSYNKNPQNIIDVVIPVFTDITTTKPAVLTHRLTWNPDTANDVKSTCLDSGSALFHMFQAQLESRLARLEEAHNVNTFRICDPNRKQETMRPKDDALFRTTYIQNHFDSNIFGVHPRA